MCRILHFLFVLFLHISSLTVPSSRRAFILRVTWTMDLPSSAVNTKSREPLESSVTPHCFSTDSLGKEHVEWMVPWNYSRLQHSSADYTNHPVTPNYSIKSNYHPCLSCHFLNFFFRIISNFCCAKCLGTCCCWWSRADNSLMPLHPQIIVDAS